MSDSKQTTELVTASSTLNLSTDVQGNEGLQDMIDNFLLFFLAGQDTTASLLSFATVELLKHPDILHR